MGVMSEIFSGGSGTSVEPYSEQGPETSIGGSRRRRRS